MEETITFRLSGRAFSQVEGSELYQRPHLYDDAEPASMRAGEALQNAVTRKTGKGYFKTVACDIEAAEVIREYFATQAEIHAGQGEPELNRDARAYAEAADRIVAAVEFSRAGTGA